MPKEPELKARDKVVLRMTREGAVEENLTAGSERRVSKRLDDAELLRQGIKTKTGRLFTRFSIKSILQNPVYLIADKDAYQYFVDNEAELFAPESGKKASPPS